MTRSQVRAFVESSSVERIREVLDRELADAKLHK